MSLFTDPKQEGNIDLLHTARTKLYNTVGDQSVEDHGVVESKLHRADKRWKRMKDRKDEDKPEAWRAKITSVINKLTLENSEIMLKRLSGLEVNTEDDLDGCLNLIISRSKRGSEQTWACASVAEELLGLSAPANLNPSKKIKFSDLLWEFLKPIVKAIDQCTLLDGETEPGLLAILSLCGEFYERKLMSDILSGTIMDKLVSQLLSSTRADCQKCVLNILKTIGASEDRKETENFNRYFKKLDEISRSEETSGQVRTMIEKLVKLRGKSWKETGGRMKVSAMRKAARNQMRLQRKAPLSNTEVVEITTRYKIINSLYEDSRPAPQKEQGTAEYSLGEKKTKKKAEEEMKMIIHDYLTEGASLDETITTIKKNVHLPHLVYTAIHYVEARETKYQHMTAILLHQLVKMKVLTTEQYLKPLRAEFKVVAYLKKEKFTPLIFENICRVIRPMVADRDVPLQFLSKAVDALESVHVTKVVRLLQPELSQRRSELGSTVGGCSSVESLVVQIMFLEPHI